MTDDADVKSYLARCKLSDNVLTALDKLFDQTVLPYNPYKSLFCSFLGCSETFVMTKSHLLSGNI